MIDAITNELVTIIIEVWFNRFSMETPIEIISCDLNSSTWWNSYQPAIYRYFDVYRYDAKLNERIMQCRLGLYQEQVTCTISTLGRISRTSITVRLCEPNSLVELLEWTKVTFDDIISN